jgi:hypothetical protein
MLKITTLAFALKFLRQTLSANEATLVVVRANEKEPLAGRGRPSRL